jgi:ribonuclease HII
MVKNRQIIGIDEVGRGPLAGPVAVCALVLKCDFDTKNLRDSKKLSPKQREVWFEKICAWKKEKKLDFKIAFVSASIIDKIRIMNHLGFAKIRQAYFF